MEEHQNTTNTDVHEDRADGSADGTPKVTKAGGEAKSGRRVLRGGASNGGNPADGSDHGATEAARTVLRAGQQALEGGRAAIYGAADAGESTGTGQVLGEWTSFVRRASLRNMQAVGDLMHCYTLSSLLQWQSNVLSATVVDVAGTNSRLLRLVTRKA